MSKAAVANRIELLSLEEALDINRQATRDYYREYINPGLTKVLALINFDKQFVRAQDVSVWDAEGKEYLDFLGGYGALNLGHNPPSVLEAIRRVMERPNLLQASLNPLAAALARNLALLAPGDLQRVFFCNSGAEAVEGALKLARAYNHERPKMLYCNNSFHGKTFGALSVTGRDKYKASFTPLLPGCEGIPFGDLAELEEHLSSSDVAAFIVEPLQGEGGVKVPPKGYLRGVRELCDRYGTLLIVDEIQTGFGRTGHLFASEHDQVTPDIMCLAKSLGGGVFPLGAYIARPKIWDAVYGGMDKYALHTSTFGGNTLAMAAGLATLQAIIKQDLPSQAARQGAYLLEQLKALNDKSSLIKEIRGQGLLVGIEFNQPTSGIWEKLSSGKINSLTNEYFGSLVAGELLNKYQIITAYTLNNPNVIRLEPPLTVSREAIDKVVDAFREILEHSYAQVMIGSIGSALWSKLKN
ncbi:MAG: putrescine aminotransferase [Firmicutes bacterium HGW-Firmicutes-12]|jgi:putrescine aminotransferase|nr:MAG: putrescine aminotransferase [Firmicutes bacterium HGW-Firmicutes-12]